MDSKSVQSLFDKDLDLLIGQRSWNAEYYFMYIRQVKDDVTYYFFVLYLIVLPSNNLKWQP